MNQRQNKVTVQRYIEHNYSLSNIHSSLSNIHSAKVKL